MNRLPRDFPTRARFARERAGYANEQAAADDIGCSRPTVVRWEKDAKSISGGYLNAAAAAYKVHPDWLLLKTDDDGFPWRPPGTGVADVVATYGVPARETPPGYVRFQLLEGAAGMGAGVVNQDYPEVIRELDIAEWEVRRKIGFLPAPGRIALITGRGPSMRPRIDHGDVVMVDTSVQAFDGDGVYVINAGGETQVKMLQMRADGLYVVSANPDYPPYRADPDSIHVGGRVLSVLGLREL